MKLFTVNVIEYFDDSVQVIHSFSDDKEGNQEAEALFTKIAKDNDFDAEDIEGGLDEGYLDHSDGGYQLFIVHS